MSTGGPGHPTRDGADPWSGPPDEAATARAVLDASGTVTHWNDGARRLLGHPAAETVGRPAAGLLADPVPPGVPPPDGGPLLWKGRVALRHRDGRRLTVRLLVHRLSERDGHPDGWLVVSPITGTTRTPQDDQLPRSAFLYAPNALALYDTDIRLRRANRAMEEVIGVTEDEVRGLRLSEIGGKPQSIELEEQLREAVRTGRPRDVRTRLRTGGETREHAWLGRIAPVWDQEGRLVAVALAAVDITGEDRARVRLQLVNDAGRRIGSTLEVGRTAQELVDVCVPRLADFATVDLLAVPHPHGAALPALEEGTLTLRRVAHRSALPESPGALVADGEVWDHPVSASPVRAVLSGEPVVLDRDDPDFLAWVEQDPVRGRRARELGVHSALTVPLSARGVTLGVAQFARYRRPDPFAPDDVLVAREIAARAAVCLDNAQRFTHERETALGLQRSLLPQTLPQRTAVQVASRYLAAAGQTGVGGDWFDVIPLSGARVGLIVGDVVGHGVQASATMGRLRTAVRTLADVDLPPDELLTHLDDLVLRLSEDTGVAEGPGDIGATCLYAVYDPVNGSCTVARAGHPPPVLYLPETAEVITVELPAGPPLGLGGLPFESAELTLPEGSVLALFTDGLVERRDRDMDEGYRRLHRAIAAPAPSLDARCEEVISTLLAGEPPGDDVALLMARTRMLDERNVAAWDIPDDPASCGIARQDVSGQLTDWGLAELVFTTELVVTELIANAIRHATGPIRLRLILDRTLIVEVSDTSSTAPHLRRAAGFDEGGRGLMLVAQLTERWGTRQSAGGKTIWAEQQLPDRP
ncbi:SpoIIE family protein phosphatase [Streptomyces harbinensis]|uniref:PAS domain S-box-containing protein n=2 Tax=Streptomyces harbinensis TaxID=1176198 RepID=A0A1I6UCG7_9ACTN|nr:SpoIIE family protein phosphatase [Streptomyces harbinensis]SFS99156.1 PAS domain S-box-containing protein [Streptomyces harbinensis]